MKLSLIGSVVSLAASTAAYGQNAFMSRPSYGLQNTSAPPLPPSKDSWYTAPNNFEAAAPGTILRLRQAPGNLTGVQVNSSVAYNILYRTTNSKYQPAWAVTTLLVPTHPDGNDKLLSYQIPYDSADVDSSPSYAMYATGVADVTAALGRGLYVNVPDYEGPLASFTAGVMSGHATLDSIRAVLSSGFGLDTDSTKYAMWGYSGGALASEWAAELQVQYAPEMNFAGAALGGLTPNVTSVVVAVSGTLEAGLIPAGIVGLSTQYPELLEYLKGALNQDGQFNATGFFATRNYTLVESIVAYINQDITKYFKTGVSALQAPIPSTIINRDGIMGYHGFPEMPIFAYKAIMDEVSPINDTDKLVNRYCEVGATIRYDRNTIGTHTSEATNGDARAVQFLTSVLGGNYNATGCQIQNVTVNATASM
ncbi:lipase 1 precursor [Lecanosticta acicola]|uniref:Lipase 1 n=1 Tax=Lecanosticta acicola TaxID=111012 RepID=A0AAI9EF37_9PEZI|nr:lipase 1 precursor [Lecanosticta acicola]